MLSMNLINNDIVPPYLGNKSYFCVTSNIQFPTKSADVRMPVPINYLKKQSPYSNMFRHIPNSAALTIISASKYDGRIPLLFKSSMNNLMIVAGDPCQY